MRASKYLTTVIGGNTTYSIKTHEWDVHVGRQILFQQNILMNKTPQFLGVVQILRYGQDNSVGRT